MVLHFIAPCIVAIGYLVGLSAYYFDLLLREPVRTASGSGSIHAAGTEATEAFTAEAAQRSFA